MQLTGENRSTRGKTCLTAILSTINPTWTDPGSNPDLPGGRPVANRLSHGRPHIDRQFTEDGLAEWSEEGQTFPPQSARTHSTACKEQPQAMPFSVANPHACQQTAVTFCQHTACPAVLIFHGNLYTVTVRMFSCACALTSTHIATLRLYFRW
jgi:hypothetical protein